METQDGKPVSAKALPQSTDEATVNAGTKIARIGKKSFEIPAHMNLAAMVECWRGDSERFEALAKMIVDAHPYFAFEIVHSWLEKHNATLLYEKDSPSPAAWRLAYKYDELKRARETAGQASIPVDQAEARAFSGIPEAPIGGSAAEYERLGWERDGFGWNWPAKSKK